jgi:uncharacterized protein
MVRTGIALVALSIIGILPADASAAPKNSGDVVQATATADKADDNGKQTVTITIAIEKPWHIYANPVGLAAIANATTEVKISGEKKPQSVDIAYPPGKVEVDTVVGNYMIYDDKVVIKATVVRLKDDTGPLKASIKLQACRTDKNGTCLLPATVEVEVK